MTRLPIALFLVFGLDNFGKDPMRNDFFGDPLPAGAVARIGTVRFRVPNRCDCLAISPDGNTLVVAGEGRFGTMDAKTGKWKTILGTQGGKTLFVTNDMFVSLLTDINIGSISKGAFLNKLKLPVRHSGSVCVQIALSMDKKWLAVCGSAQNEVTAVTLWSIDGFQQQRTFELKGEFAFYSPLAFSPDSNVLALGGNLDGSVAFIEIATGRLKFSQKSENNAVFGIAFSPTEQLMVTQSYDGTVRLWTYPDRKEVVSFRVDSESSDGVCFSPDGSKLLVPEKKGNQFSVRDLKGNIVIIVPSYRASFCGKGDELLYYESGALRFMDLRSKKVVIRYSSMREISTVRFIGNDEIWVSEKSWSQENSASRWNWKNGKQHANMSLESGFCVRQDGKVMATGSGKLVEIRNGVSAEKSGAIPAPGNVYRLRFSENGNFLAATCWQPSSTDIVVGYDVTTENAICQFSGSCGVFSPDGSLFAYLTVSSMEKSQVAIYNTKTKQTIRDSYIGNEVIFSPDGKSIVLAGVNGTIQIREVEGLKQIAEFDAHGPSNSRLGSVSCVAFNPKGSFLATSSAADQKVRIWDFRKRTLVKEFSAPEGTNKDLNFSPDGHWLASCGESTTVLVWELP
jgi:WD40 repeat protein